MGKGGRWRGEGNRGREGCEEEGEVGIGRRAGVRRWRRDLGEGRQRGGEMRGQRAQGADDMMGSLPGGHCAAPTRSARGPEDLR